MTTRIRLAAVALDCPDPRALGTFYSRLAGLPIGFASDDFVALEGSPWLTLHRVEGYQAPTWPANGIPKQIHLDFATDDLDAAVEIAAAFGATLADHQPRPETWRVLLDPVGHPFCFTTLVPDP